MSKSWYPYEFVLALKDDSIVKNPHIVCFNEKGEIVGENNRELCEKYPYVAFFTPLISDVYDENKNKAEFQEKCSVLNKDLALITDCLVGIDPGLVNEKTDMLMGMDLTDGLKEYFFAKDECKGKDPFDNQISFVNEYFGFNISRSSYENDFEK